MNMEFSARFSGWPRYSASCRDAVDRLLAKGGSLSAYRSNAAFHVGPAENSWAWRLEREVCRLFGFKHAVATNSGTMALQAGLHAMDLPKGGEVVTTPFTFSATTAAIIHAGLTPVFADVHPETFCLDPTSVKRVISKRTVALLPVDLFGRLADYGALAEFGLPILEDSCQAVGARRGKKWAGSFGIIGVFSYNGLKNVPAGEAGTMVTDDDELALRARKFCSHGENWRDGELVLGMNGRINELTACVAWHGLREVLRNNAARRRLLRELWKADAAMARFGLPFYFPLESELHALYVCPLLLPAVADRPLFVRRMRDLGVEVGEGYIRPPLHKYPAFAHYTTIPLPVVEDLSARRLCLLSQVRPPATLADMRYIARAIGEALGGPSAGRRRAVGHVKESVF